MRERDTPRLDMHVLVVACTLALLFSTDNAMSQQTKPDEKKPEGEIVFVPPDTGAPADLVGAATRTVGTEGRIVTLLVPEGGGVTTTQKPPLVWYLSDGFVGEMQSQIMPVNAPGGGVRKTTEGRFRQGYYALDLSRSEMLLEPDTIYEWKVALLGRDSGKIVDQKVTYLQVRNVQVSASVIDAKALAAAGLWFDALATFVEIDFSGRVRVNSATGFHNLISSGGVALP